MAVLTCHLNMAYRYISVVKLKLFLFHHDVECDSWNSDFERRVSEDFQEHSPIWKLVVFREFCICHC